MDLEELQTLVARMVDIGSALSSTRELGILLEMIVDEACFAKNAMLSIGKTTPYKALVGQAPNLLQDFEVPNTSMMEDPQHAHRARARELALGTIVEQTARMRLERTLKAKS